MVHTDDLAGEGRGFDGTEVAKAFGTPRLPMRFAVCASRAKGGWDVGKVMRQDVGASKELQFGEAEVTEALMMDKESVLFALGIGKGRIDR